MTSYVIDSSGWIEVFAAGPRTRTYLKYIQSRHPLITPTLVLYEIYKKIAAARGEPDAVLAVTQIRSRSAQVVPLDDRLALAAADTSLRHKLAMADAIIYATARSAEATLITGDHHFATLPHVLVI